LYNFNISFERPSSYILEKFLKILDFQKRNSRPGKIFEFYYSSRIFFLEKSLKVSMIFYGKRPTNNVMGINNTTTCIYNKNHWCGTDKGLIRVLKLPQVALSFHTF
jgi:hypothetical protein